MERRGCLVLKGPCPRSLGTALAPKEPGKQSARQRVAGRASHPRPAPSPPYDRARHISPPANPLAWLMLTRRRPRRAAPGPDAAGLRQRSGERRGHQPLLGAQSRVSAALRRFSSLHDPASPARRSAPPARGAPPPSASSSPNRLHRPATPPSAPSPRNQRRSTSPARPTPPGPARPAHATASGGASHGTLGVVVRAAETPPPRRRQTCSAWDRTPNPLASGCVGEHRNPNAGRESGVRV